MPVERRKCSSCKTIKPLWHFGRDPEGRRCYGCVQNPAPPKRQPKSELRLAREELRAALRFLHEEKLQGRTPPLTAPDELSVYNPRGRSCLRAEPTPSTTSLRRSPKHGTSNQPSPHGRHRRPPV